MYTVILNINFDIIMNHNYMTSGSGACTSIRFAAPVTVLLAYHTR